MARSRVVLGVVVAVAAALSLNVGVAAAQTVTCSAAGNTFSVTVAGATDSGDVVAISATGGDYVVTVGGTRASPEMGTAQGGNCAGVAFTTYQSVSFNSGSNQYLVIDNSNGAFASGTNNCQVMFNANLTGTTSTVQVNADSNPSAAPGDDAIGVDNGQHLSLSEGACTGTNQVSFNGGVQTVVVVGSTTADTTNKLDLNPATNVALNVAGGENTLANPGSVTGFSPGGFTTVEFSNEQIIAGSTATNTNNGTTFVPDLASGITFQGNGVGNTLDLSSEPSNTFASFNVAQAAPATVTQCATGTGAITSTVPAMSTQTPITDCFSGISTVKGANVPTNWQPAPTTNGVTFVGASTADATLDLSTETGFGSFQVTMVTVDGGTSQACPPSALVGTLQSSNGSPDITDSFCLVGTVLGASTINTTFEPGPVGPVAFVGGTGPGVINTVNLTAATGFTTLTAAMTGGADMTGCSTPVGRVTSTGGTPDIADPFCNVSIVVGSPSTSTTFQPNGASSVLFAGGTGSGVVNTLDLSGTTGFSTLTVATSGGTAPADCGNSTTTPVGDVTSTGGSPNITDPFCNVTAVNGSDTVPTTFQPGTTTGITFSGEDPAAGGAVVDLSGEPSAAASSTSGFTSLTVQMTAGSSTCTTSQGELTSTGAAPITDCLNGVTTVNGASAVATYFEPNPNLSATPAVVPQFVGNDALPGGAIVDLRNIASPDSNGDTISGLTVSLPENTAASPGSVTATVNGSPVTYATFYGITTAIGSTTLATSVAPGDVNGVALALIPRAPQPVTFTSTPPSPAKIGETYGVSATGGASGNTVTFGIDQASTPGTCSLSGTIVTFKGAGTCVIDAGQLGTHEYAPGTAQQTITVAGAPAPPPPPPPTVTGQRVAKFRAGATATLHVKLSEPATIKFTVTGSIPGHRAGKACKPGVKRHAKRCSIAVRAAQLTVTGAAGQNALKLALTKLAPGRYTGTLVATNSAGESSSPKTVTFTVTAPSHRKRR